LLSSRTLFFVSFMHALFTIILLSRQPHLSKWMIRSDHSASSSANSTLQFENGHENSGLIVDDEAFELQRCRMLVDNAKRLLK